MASIGRGLLLCPSRGRRPAVAGTLTPRPLSPILKSGSANRRILVISNPIHTDIAIPLDPACGPVRAAGARPDKGRLSGARYLVFGWGSRAFYIETPTWAD